MTADDVEIRRHFPYLDRVLYLNTAAAGLAWSGEGDAIGSFYTDAMSKGINGLPDWQKRGLGVREKLAALLRVRPENIQFVGSTTEALNLTARSIRFNPGDRVVLASDEFPSVVYPWLQVAESNPGVVVEQVAVEREEEREASLLAALTPDTRVLAVSHVHWCTGTRVNLSRLSEACRARGAMLVVDGIQALGAIPVTLGDEVDVYCAAVFKWMLSGFGLAIWVVSDRALQMMQPAQRGYENPPPELKLRYSHWNYPGLFALAGSIDLLEGIGWEPIHRRVADNAAHLSSGLRSLGYQVVTPGEAHAGIVSFAVSDPALVSQMLEEREVFVAARGKFLRVSPHFYNTQDEIDRFLHLINELAPPSR